MPTTESHVLILLFIIESFLWEIQNIIIPYEVEYLYGAAF
jgi:hypothetical protein